MLKKTITIVSITSLFASLTATSVFAALDVTTIPLGDGKVSSSPKIGYVYSCQQTFNANAPGASTNGSWIHGSTWSLPEKLQVEGRVTWPTAQYSSSISSDTRTITSNSLPTNSHTGTFPIASTDPAYQVDRNPNSISAQSVSLSLPLTPTIQTSATCVGMGMIGVATNGVAIFNALDAGGRDAVAHEVQDICGGHPEKQGEYHYHGPSTCLPNQDKPNTLVGYALDGFGIYSGISAEGKVLENSDLDECHGTTSPVVWDGKTVSMYHYVLTKEYPYTIGCYRGAPATPNNTQGTTQSATGMSMPTMMNITTSMMTPSSSPLTENLSVGSKGDAVQQLQTFLEAKGFLTIPSDQGKGYFGGLTKKALIKYQQANNIQTTGTFGPKTRMQFNKERQEKDNRVDNNISKAKDAVPDSNTSNKVDSTKKHNQQTGRPVGAMMVRTPPQVAYDACNNKSATDSCSFSGAQGEAVAGVCLTRPDTDNKLVCGPANMGAR